MVEYKDLYGSGDERPEAREPGEISISGTEGATSVPSVETKAVILTTKRLTLRPPAARDLATLIELANNPKVAENLGTMPHPYTADDAWHWISHVSKPAVRQQTFAITGRFQDNFLGGCGYRPIDGEPEQISIGYWLGEEHWGQGYAAEAAQAMIDHAFEEENIQSVWVSVRATNHQSKRVVEKCGFQFAHHGMSQSLALNGMVSIDYYSITRRTWESLHLWGER